MARKAAEAEYILHGIYVHLVEAQKAYRELAVATGGALVQQCRKKREAATLSASCKSSLAEDLDAAEEGFAATEPLPTRLLDLRRRVLPVAHLEGSPPQ